MHATPLHNSCTVTAACKLPSILVSSCLSGCPYICPPLLHLLCFSASDTRIWGWPLQVKVLEGAQPSTTMKSQAGLGGGSLAATQQRGPATPGSPNQQTMKGFNKSGKGMTARPMGATLPVSLLLHVVYSGLHLSNYYCSANLLFYTLTNLSTSHTNAPRPDKCTQARLG